VDRRANLAAIWLRVVPHPQAVELRAMELRAVELRAVE
jgi:hypothetical protein